MQKSNRNTIQKRHTPTKERTEEKSDGKRDQKQKHDIIDKRYKKHQHEQTIDITKGMKHTSKQKRATETQTDNATTRTKIPPSM